MEPSKVSDLLGVSGSAGQIAAGLGMRGGAALLSSGTRDTNKSLRERSAAEDSLRTVMGVTPIGQLLDVSADLVEATVHAGRAFADLRETEAKIREAREYGEVLARRVHAAEAAAMDRHLGVPGSSSPTFGTSGAGGFGGMGGGMSMGGVGPSGVGGVDPRVLAEGRIAAPAPEGLPGHPVAFGTNGAAYTPADPSRAAGFVPGTAPGEGEGFHIPALDTSPMGASLDR